MLPKSEILQLIRIVWWVAFSWSVHKRHGEEGLQGKFTLLVCFWLYSGVWIKRLVKQTSKLLLDWKAMKSNKAWPEFWRGEDMAAQLAMLICGVFMCACSWSKILDTHSLAVGIGLPETGHWMRLLRLQKVVYLILCREIFTSLSVSR